MTCDIVIPVYNQLEYTRACLESIKKYTHYPYRLIVIDNGSNRETRDYLKELSRDESLKVLLIRNETNLGYVKAINQGLRISNADYVCLLNNDTKVGKNWLEELIKVAKSDKKIGIVNPGGSPRSLRRKDLEGEWIEIGFAIGFCMLIKKEVIEKIGLLDEAYEIGFWEDIDYCRRAKNAGYICVAAKAAYVYHHSHSTFNLFQKNKVNELFEKNKNIFYSKWGRLLRIAFVISEKEISEKLTNDMLNFAREGHIVYLFLKSSVKIKSKLEHGSVRLIKYPDILFKFCVLMRILNRQKKKEGKRFDKILVDNPNFVYKLQFIVPNLKIDII